MIRVPLGKREAFPAAVTLAGAIVIGLAALVVFRPGPSSPGGTLTAAFTRTSAWDGGYAGDYVIRNGGPATSGWVLRFELPAGERITNEWNGALTASGSSYVVTNLDWDAHIPQGATEDVGFQVESTGALAPPTGCTLNGNPCAGGPASPSTTTTAPAVSSAPTTTAAPPTTAPAGTLPPATNPAGVPGTGAFAFAPYVDTTVDTPPFDLAADLAATGTRYFTLAFVVADHFACRASWGGYYSVASGYYHEEIAALRAAGGDVSISFGGEAGRELAEACPSVSALETQYRLVVDEYHVKRIDFDIEGADLLDSTAMQRRFEAVAALQKSDPSLSVSVTLPVTPTGLDPAGLAVLDAAFSAGARVDLVNVMTMDFWSTAPNPAGRMGAYAIAAAEATHAQLASLYPGLGAAQLWRMLGVTPMPGVNDDPAEVFSVSDAKQLLTFAERVGLGRLSMWAATRDTQCPSGTSTPGSDRCSGITQRPWDFSDLFAAYR